MEPGIHVSNPIFMQQTQLKDNIFSTQVNTVQASDLETRAETRYFSLKKVSDAQLFAARTSILIFSTRLDKINISNWRVPKHRTFPWSKN